MNERSGVLVEQKFRQYLFPTLLTALAFSTGSLLETVMVGHFLDDAALAAVALAEPIAMTIDTIYLRISVGGLTCATVALGKLDKRKSNLIFTLALMSGFALMTLMWLVMQVFLEPITLLLADGDAGLASLAVGYLRPMLYVGPVLMFGCTTADFINADGRPRYAASIFVSASLIRVMLGYVMMRYLNTGLWGAGFATVVGYAVGAAMVIPYMLSRKRRSFRFVLPKWADLKELVSILRAGLSTSWLGMCEMLCVAVLILLISQHMGASSLAVLIICMNITTMIDVFIDGVTDTLIPIAGVLYGEQDYFGIRQVLKFARNVLLIICAAIMLGLLLMPQSMCMLFDIDSSAVMRQVIPAVRMYALYLPLYAMNILLQYYYNTVGRIQLASALAALKSLVFVLLYALLLINTVSETVWMCFAFAEASALLVVVLLCRRIKKKEKLSDLYLLPSQNPKSVSLDLTVASTVEEAVKLSQRIIEFGQKTTVSKSLINHIAVAVEEMIISTAHYAHEDSGKGLIDVAVRVTDQKVVVRFRDNGIHFNPMEYIPPDERSVADGIVLIRKLASSIQYSRRLGFNTTYLTFQR